MLPSVPCYIAAVASYNVYIEERCDLKKWGLVIIVWDEILLSFPWILPKKVFNLINFGQIHICYT